MSETLKNLKKTVLEYDNQSAVDLAKAVLAEGLEPTLALTMLTEAIREVGDGFGRGELFLPDLIGAASAMKSATDILETKICEMGSRRESMGKVVIGTVYGDIHDIGKNMVAVLLSTEGFEVIDIGVNVRAEQFIDAVKKNSANILAMSSLLTTTASEQKKVIDTLKHDGIRDNLKIMVGGGAITQGFADAIGADGYSPTAPGAAKLARQLMRTELKE